MRGRVATAYLVLLAGTVMLVPITAGFRISAQYPVIFAARPIILVGVLAAVVRRLRRRDSSSGHPVSLDRPPWNPVALYLGIFLIAMAASVPMSVAPRMSVFRWLALLFEWGGVFVVVWEFLTDRSQCRQYLNAIVVLTAAVTVLGLIEEATGFNVDQILRTGYQPDIFFYHALVRGGILRVRSTFPHPIEYAAFLAFILPVILVLFINAGKGTARRLHAVTALLVGVNLLLTLSLGPIAGAAIGLVLLAFLLGNRSLVLSLCGAAVLLTVLLIFPGHRVFEDLIGNRLNFNTFSGGHVASRIAIVMAALGAFVHHPLFGSGLNTWFVVKPHAEFAGWSNTLGGAGNENFYAEVLVETGLVGLAATVLLLFVLARMVWESYKNSVDQSLRRLLIGLFCGLVAYYTLNLTANVFSTAQPTTMFWIVVTCCLKLVALSQTEVRAPVALTPVPG